MSPENISQISLLVALVSLLFAGMTFFNQRKANSHQNNLNSREIELIRAQLSLMEAEAKREKCASISAKIHSIGQSQHRLYVTNEGPAIARNVRLALDEQNHMVSHQSARSKFPMETMERGQTVEITAHLFLAHPLKEEITIIWDDGSGLDRTKRISITA